VVNWVLKSAGEVNERPGPADGPTPPLRPFAARAAVRPPRSSPPSKVSRRPPSVTPSSDAAAVEVRAGLGRTSHARASEDRD
jgi:hypothetical protein